MLLKEILNVYDLLDSATANGDAVANYLKSIRADANVEVVHIDTPKGSTDVVRVLVAGTNGRSVGGSAPTIGLMGWLGGIAPVPVQSAMFLTAMALWWRWRSRPSCWTCRTRATVSKATSIWQRISAPAHRPVPTIRCP